MFDCVSGDNLNLNLANLFASRVDRRSSWSLWTGSRVRSHWRRGSMILGISFHGGEKSVWRSTVVPTSQKRRVEMIRIDEGRRERFCRWTEMKLTNSHDRPVHVTRKWSGCRRSKRLERKTRPAFAVLPCVCLFVRKKNRKKKKKRERERERGTWKRTWSRKCAAF